MLVSLNFSNFRSFAGEARLSFVANSSDHSMRSSLHPIAVGGRDVALLPSIAIYGANAAGKSNVLLALEYIRDAVRASHSSWLPNSGTHIPQVVSTNQDASKFEIEVYIDGNRFQYGFEATRRFFQNEWLIGFTGARSHTLFRRQSDEEGRVNLKVGPKFEGGQKSAQILEGRLRPNSLFLSLAAQENFPDALKILNWLDQDVNIPPIRFQADPLHASITSGLASKFPEFKSRLMEIMKSADSTISDIEITSSESSASVAELASSLPEGLREYFEESNKYKVVFILKGADGDIRIPFVAQSKGVQKVYSMAGYIISSITHGELMVIDELEASMHPHIARTIVDLFQSSATNKNGAQLLFVTHDTNLLDQSLIRRDQVWFVEKDGCKSHLYSLLEFSPRKDEDLERGYLRGRYGAVPVPAPTSGWLDDLALELDIDDEEEAPTESL